MECIEKKERKKERKQRDIQGKKEINETKILLFLLEDFTMKMVIISNYILPKLYRI